MTDRAKRSASEAVHRTTRRAFLSSSLGAIGTGGVLLSCLVAGQTRMLTPRQAYAAKVPLAVLSEKEARTLEAVAEAIVPGARESGIAQFVDKQLSLPLDQSLLMIKYLGVPAPFDGFYQSGLAALAKLSDDTCNKPWYQLNADQSSSLIDRVATNDVGDWAAPPAPFVFFVFRADACDMVYGTEQGFANIGMPYMAHIDPVPDWHS